MKLGSTLLVGNPEISILDLLQLQCISVIRQLLHAYLVMYLTLSEAPVKIALILSQRAKGKAELPMTIRKLPLQGQYSPAGEIHAFRTPALEMLFAKGCFVSRESGVVA